MTLRPCTVTQLDDAFWRVDFEGEIMSSTALDGTTGPTVIRKRRFRFEFVEVNALVDFLTIDAALEFAGLTRDEPKTETAEERVRQSEAIACRKGWSSVSLYQRDLRAVLAELDRLRSERREPDTITPRDLFAQAWLRNETHWQGRCDEIAARAFEMADAMMKERAR